MIVTNMIYRISVSVSAFIRHYQVNGDEVKNGMIIEVDGKDDWAVDALSDCCNRSAIRKPLL